MKLEIEYLTPEHLKGFENYKYSSLDTSPLSIYITHPFWNKTVELFPRWIAPNLLTFTGFLFTVLNLLIFTKYDYYLYASSNDHPEYPPIPNWVFALSALNLFMAHTLDGIDGKQARRTQSSNPLGELFDHGLDSWTSMSITMCMLSIFGRSDYSISPLRMYFILWNILVNFYLSHWEKYNTGVLFLPWGYDASMIAMMFIFFITGVYGYNMWKFSILGGYTSGQIFEIIVYLSTIVGDVPIVLWNIYKSYRDKTGKMRSFSEAIRPLVSLVLLFGISTAWFVYSPNNIMERDPRIIIITIGTIFSNICCRLIVSQMSNTRCEILPWCMLPFIVAVVVSFLKPKWEIFSLYALAFVSLVSHIHYGTCIVRQMCRHFRIKAFKIKDISE